MTTGPHTVEAALTLARRMAGDDQFAPASWHALHTILTRVYLHEGRDVRAEAFAHEPLRERQQFKALVTAVLLLVYSRAGEKRACLFVCTGLHAARARLAAVHTMLARLDDAAFKAAVFDAAGMTLDTARFRVQTMSSSARTVRGVHGDVVVLDEPVQAAFFKTIVEPMLALTDSRLLTFAANTEQ